MTIDLAQLVWIMYVLILGAVFFFIVYLVKLLMGLLPVIKNLNVTLEKTNVMLDDVQGIVSDTKEITDDVTVKYQQANEMLGQVSSQLGSVFGSFFSSDTKTEKADIINNDNEDEKGSM
ncbi:MAG: DUF948 domain-containing protein [Culicoidibacterales bacterium]